MKKISSFNRDTKYKRCLESLRRHLNYNFFSLDQIWFWAPCKFFGNFQLSRAQSTGTFFVIFPKKFPGRRVYGPKGLALDFTNFLQPRGEAANSEANESFRRVLD